MLELLSTYSFSQIVIFIVVLALAIKQVISFYDWAAAKIKSLYGKQRGKEHKEEEFENRLEKGSEFMHHLEDNQAEIFKILENITEQINVLIQSDKDDIKTYITEKHHYYCYDKEWIDDYSLDGLEKRFSHYVEEGGNSYIEKLMKELRELPNQPPHE